MMMGILKDIWNTIDHILTETLIVLSASFMIIFGISFIVIMLFGTGL